MPLDKNTINIAFSQGLDTKTDPFQVAPGKFLSLDNIVFSKGGLLKKRNGFKELAILPDDSVSTYLTSFNGNLTAIGTSLNAYGEANGSFVTKGQVTPLLIDTLSVIRSNSSQTQADMAMAPNGFSCVVYSDSSGGATTYKYAVIDTETGQNIVAPTAITPSSGAVTGAPRVFSLGGYFVILFSATISAVRHLQFIAVNSNVPTSVTAATDISSQFSSSDGTSFNGVVANNALYVAWNGNDGGGAIRATYIDITLTQHSTVVFSGRVGTLIDLAADVTGSSTQIYVSIYDSGTSTGFIFSFGPTLVTIFSPQATIVATSVLNIASSAQAGSCTFFYEVSNNYSYDSSIPTHFIRQNSCSLTGTVGSSSILIRSLGLASKAFIVDGVIYFTGIYYSLYQPTYFVISSNGQIVAKLAYENAGSYLTQGLGQVNVSGSRARFCYLFKDTINPVNQTQGSTLPAIYSNTGINLATLTFGTSRVVSSEIGQSLIMTGGLTYMYDGFEVVELGFNVFADNVECTWSATGGSVVAKPDGLTNTNAYFYQVTYEWTDNQGNIHRSAPSLPVGVTTTGAGTSGSITVNVPYLRLTAKTANPVKIVIYRWSAGQQTYYQVTSISSPTLNSTTSDSLAFVDTAADSSIIGNSILYTTGGVVENIAPPSFSSRTLFRNRLFGVDSEDKNLLWFSKQVIESTPVEMSDLFTIYVAPAASAQTQAGPITALSSMDDKLIIFKNSSIYYLTGNGPDITGANDDFSDPVFITSTVGCTNESSIVFTPQGLMFQSDKGIWILGRDLSTNYIGAPVERYNGDTVVSAVNVPATNEVRFSLSSGITLVYDYFYGQWGTFSGISNISATLYKGMHTVLTADGRILMESPFSYLDNTTPVLMSFKTGWMNLAGVQGYERAYFFYLLASYLSPHKLSINIAYDYAESPTQSILITPDNFAPSYGADSIYGSPPNFGGPGALEQWRVFFSQQKCQSFQIELREIYDPSLGVTPGAGFTLSSLNLVVGVKKGYPSLSDSRQTG